MKKIIKNSLFSLIVVFSLFILISCTESNNNQQQIPDDTEKEEMTLQSNIINVYLIGGQSNSVGYGMDTNNTIANSDSRFVNGFDNVLYYGAQERWGSAPLLNSKFQPVKLGMGCDVNRSGAEIGIASAIADNGEMNAIIKCAWGATHLYPDYNYAISLQQGTWTPPSYIENHNVDLSKNPKIGRMYRWFEETVTEGIRLLKEDGYTPVIKGMWWMQGEAEMFTTQMSGAYEELYRTLISDVRNTVGKITGYDCSEMPFVCGLPKWNTKNSPAPAYQHIVRGAMTNVGNDSSVKHASYVDCMPLNQHDDWHFDAAGQKYLGENFISELEKFDAENEGYIAEFAEHIYINNDLKLIPDKKGLRFSAGLTNYDTNNNYSYGFLLVPTEELNEYEIHFDYVNELHNNDITYIDLKAEVDGVDLGEYDEIIIEGEYLNIKYDDFNTNYTIIAYLKDEQETYHYSSAHLNDSLSHIASKELYTSTTMKDEIKKIVDAGVNLLFNVPEKNAYKESNLELIVNSTFNLPYSQTNEKYNIGLELNPNIDYYISYKSNNEKVVTIDNLGDMTVVGIGSTTITIECGGKTKEVPVTVEKISKDNVSFDAVISSNEYAGEIKQASNNKASLKYIGKVVNGDVYLGFELTHGNWSPYNSSWWNNDNIEFRLNDTSDSYKVVFYEGVPSFSDGIKYGIASTKEVDGKLVTTIELCIEGNSPAYQLQVCVNGTNIGWFAAVWGYDQNNIKHSTTTAYITVDGVKIKEAINLGNGLVLDGNLTEDVYTTNVKNNIISTTANGAKISIIGTLVNKGVLLGVTVNHTKAPNVSTNGGTNYFNYMNIEFHFNNNINEGYIMTVQNITSYSKALSYCKTVNNGSSYTSTFEIFISFEEIGVNANSTSVSFTCSGWFESGWAWLFPNQSSWISTHDLTVNGIVKK